MRLIIVILLALFAWTNISAQKSPYHIRNYKPTEYGGFTQTWQVLQDERGLIFLASTSNIFSYDGVRWNGIPVKIGAATRQIHYDSTTQTIYVGSVQEFGCLERDTTGYYTFHSFMDQLTPEESVFTDVWKIQQQGKKIYFQSAEHIFIVEDKKVVGRIDPQEGSTFALMFNCGGRIYVRQRGVGLMEISGNTMTLIPNSEMFGSVRLMGMLQMDANTNYLLTNNEGFVRMSNVSSPAPVFEYFPIANDTFLRESGVLGIEWINDREFAVCSRYGLMIYNKKFEPTYLFNKATGLNDESISELFVDREKNIWLAFNNGCSMISYTAPALMFSEDNGFDGTLEMLEITGDTMYICSSTGLFRSVGIHKGQMNMPFERVPGIPNEAWDITVAGPSVLASSSTGVYEVIGNSTTHITDRYTNCVSWIDTNRTLLTAEKGGFSVLTVDRDRNWKEAMHFEMPGTELLRTAKPELNSEGNFEFTALSRFKTAYRIEFNYTDSLLQFREYTLKNGMPVEDCFTVKIGDTVYYVSYTTAFRYRPELDINDSSVCITRAPDIFDRLFNGETEHISNLVDYRLFLERPIDDEFTRFFGRSGTTPISATVMLGRIFINSNLQLGRADTSGYVWILSQQTISKFDLSFHLDTNVRYDAIITHVRFAGDSMEYYYPNAEIEVPYTLNSMKFDFAAPYFMYDMGSMYRYQLLGYDTAWSGKSRTTEKEYTNLPEGTYTFVVEAVNPFGVYSRQARFTFTILPPWYRTTWAYGVYVIGFILFVFVAIRISARTLRKQKERLEEIVTERTAEVVDQKHQLEKQKVDLEEAYTGIQDSIVYSQRIQNAILPTADEIKRIVPESFVLFFPRDIVSGDFYWFAEKNHRKFIACVDCTGHGVPGALMSMIGNTILNQIIIEKNITAPDQVLNHLHVGVRQALKQDVGGDTRDGMDLSLIVMDQDKSELYYAGANRNLWIIRNGALLETKAEKVSIAGSQPEEVRRFKAHTIPLQKSDVIYMTTDGYADQFGGPRGKKFMVKQLTRLLLEIHLQPMEEQKKVLEQKFHSWKTSLEQVDDVLIIGIRA